MHPVKVRLSEAYLNELASREDSYVYRKELIHHIVLDPSGLADVKSAIRKTLDAGINKYDKKIGGLFLGYSNIKLVQNIGLLFYEDSFVHLDITADFYIFTPELGCSLTGIVTKIGENHVGCLVHKVFNASVINATEEKEDWPGCTIQTGQEVRFEVTVLDMTGPLPYIRGKFSEVPMAKEMQVTGDKTKKSRKKKLKLEVCVEDYSIEPKKKRKKVVSEIAEVQHDMLLGDVNEVPVSDDFASHVTPASFSPLKKKRKRSDESIYDLEHLHRQKKKSKEDPKRSESTHEIQSDLGTSQYEKVISNGEVVQNFSGTSSKKHKKKLSLGILPQNHAANSGSREINEIMDRNEEGVENQNTINIITASKLSANNKKKKKKHETLELDVLNVFQNPDAKNMHPAKTSDVSHTPSAPLPVKEKNKKITPEPELDFVKENKMSEVSPTKKKKKKLKEERIPKLLPSAENIADAQVAELSSPLKSNENSKEMDEKELNKCNDVMLEFPDDSTSALIMENIIPKNVSSKKHGKVKKRALWYEGKIIDEPQNDFIKENEEFLLSPIKKEKNRKPAQESVSETSSASLFSPTKSVQIKRDNEAKLKKHKNSDHAVSDSHKSSRILENVQLKNISPKNSKQINVKKTKSFQQKIVGEPQSDFAEENEDFKFSGINKKKINKPVQESVTGITPLVSLSKSYENIKDNEDILNKLKDSVLAFAESHRNVLAVEKSEPKNVSSKNSKHKNVRKTENFEKITIQEPDSDFEKKTVEFHLPHSKNKKNKKPAEERKSQKTTEESVPYGSSDLHSKTLETLLARAKSMINEPAELLSTDIVIGTRKTTLSSKPEKVNSKNVTTSEEIVPTPTIYTSKREKMYEITPSTHGKSEETGKAVGNDSIAQLLSIAQHKLSNFELSDEAVLGKISPKKPDTSSRSRSQRLSVPASKQKTSSPLKLHLDSLGSAGSKQLEHAVPVPSPKAPTLFDTCSLQLSPEPLQQLINAEDEGTDEENLAAIYKTPEYFRSDSMANAEDRRSSKSNRRSLLSLNKPATSLLTTAHLHEEVKSAGNSGGGGSIRRGHGVEGLSGFLTSDDDSCKSENVASSKVSITKSADGLKDITSRLLGLIPNLAQNLAQNKGKENQMNTESTGTKDEVPVVGISKLHKLHPSVKPSKESARRSSELESMKSENLGKYGVMTKVKRKKEETKEHKRHKNKSKNLDDLLDEGDVDKIREQRLKSYLSRLTLE